MFGSIIKYTAVALAGAVVFTTAGFFMDAEVIDTAKESCENFHATLSDLDPDELKVKMAAFILVNRSGWVAQLTFASSVKDLDAVLDSWA